jgi:hypothetical protein
MWCSLVLQTLPSTTLRTYLPNDSQNLAPWAGKKLNIAPPILQVLSKKTHFKNAENKVLKGIDLDYQNPLMLEYLKERIRSF